MAAKKEDRIPLAVGSTVWRIDYGGPGSLTVARGVKVESETRMSWVLTNGVKVPKTQAEPILDVSGFRTTTYALTRETAEKILLRQARWRMASIIQECGDPDVLRKVADALGVTVTVED